MTTLQKNIVNLVVFNLVWLLCVLGGNTVAAIAVTVTLVLHIKFISSGMKEIWFIGFVALLGVAVEFGFVWWGALMPANQEAVPPLWLLSLWPLFATTLNHSTRWFQKNLWWATVAGAIAGPLTYYTGTRLTSYSLGDPVWHSFFKLILVWALVFPLVMWVARKYVTADSALRAGG